MQAFRYMQQNKHVVFDCLRAFAGNGGPDFTSDQNPNAVAGSSVDAMLFSPIVCNNDSVYVERTFWVKGQKSKTKMNFVDIVIYSLEQNLERVSSERCKIAGVVDDVVCNDRVSIVPFHRYVKNLLGYIVDYDIDMMKSVLISMFIFFDRMFTDHERLILMRHERNKLAATCMLVSLKVLRDCNWTSNGKFAELCMIERDELNDLEMTFLNAMDFRLYISREEFKENYYEFKDLVTF